MPFPLPGKLASSHPCSSTCDLSTFPGPPKCRPRQKGSAFLELQVLEHKSHCTQVSISQPAPTKWPDCLRSQSQFLMQVFVLRKKHKQREHTMKVGARTGGKSVGWPTGVYKREGNQDARQSGGLMCFYNRLFMTDCYTHFSRQMGLRNNFYLLPNK